MGNFRPYFILMLTSSSSSRRVQDKFDSRQVRGNRLLIHGELYQRTLKQDILKQRPS